MSGETQVMAGESALSPYLSKHVFSSQQYYCTACEYFCKVCRFICNGRLDTFYVMQRWSRYCLVLAPDELRPDLDVDCSLTKYAGNSYPSYPKTLIKLNILWCFIRSCQCVHLIFSFWNLKLALRWAATMHWCLGMSCSLTKYERSDGSCKGNNSVGTVTILQCWI